MTDYYSSPPPSSFRRSFGSPFDVNNSNLSGKKRRNYEEEDDSENAYPHHPVDKRARSKGFVTPSFQNEERIQELERALQRYEEEIHFLKENMEQKDEQLHAISNENSELNHQCESFVENTSKLNEENRILKKAVGIQETRLRELQQQTQHMQDVMNQAADYISGLERTNAALRSRVEADHSSRSSYLPDVPPDVY